MAAPGCLVRGGASADNGEGEGGGVHTMFSFLKTFAEISRKPKHSKSDNDNDNVDTNWYDLILILHYFVFDVFL